MKLIEHVLNIRNLISRAISNRFERLRLTENPDSPVPSLSEEDGKLREHLKAIVNYHAATTSDYAEARKLAINECTFTLFNRLAALKVMEDKDFFPPVIARSPESGGRSENHNGWLQEHPEGRGMERDGLVEFFIDRFREESENFPIFSETHPYAVMPRADELNEIIDAFNAVADDPDCGEDIWRGDDILGWLYENFNATEKAALKEDGGKTEYDKVSLQSQVYTPQWVVKFLVDNTVGKMYLEMFPESNIDRKEDEKTHEIKYRIANRPTERTREQKDLRTWKIIDPACGSGNFLIYTLSLMYDLYVDQMENFGANYSKREIPAMIIENNLYGVDLDERAVQLSQIALRIKAREIGRKRFRIPKHTNVVSTNFHLPSFSDSGLEKELKTWDINRTNLVEKIWKNLGDARKFGSLIRVDEEIRNFEEYELNQLRASMQDLFADQQEDSVFSFSNTAITMLRNKFQEHVGTDKYSQTKFEDAIKFLEIVNQKYDVAVANPPYTDSSDFGSELKQFVENNYKKPYKFHTNLYASFIRRCWELTSDTGKVGMIHPHTFMFIKSFEDVRKFLIEKTSINVMVDFGLDRVNLFGPGVLLDATFYTFDKGQNNVEGIYFDITNGLQEKFKKDTIASAFLDLCEGRENNRIYRLPQDKLRQIKSWPFIYWISDDFRKKFSIETIEDNYANCQGLITSNNERFLKHWWEVRPESINTKWFYYSKGGPFNKWYGNIWLVVDWENDGENIKGFVDEKGKQKSRPQNERYYFSEGVTYCGSGSKGTSFRYKNSYWIFDSGGSSIFTLNKLPNNYMLAILNSTIAKYIVNCLNPTVNTQVGDIGRIPIVRTNIGLTTKIGNLSQQNIDIKKHLCKFSLIEPLFEKSPIQPGNLSAKECVASYYIYENGLLTQVLLNEAIINREVFDIYELSDNDRKMVLDKEGIPVGDLPVSEIAKSNYLQWLQINKEFPASEELVAHINSLPVSEDQPHLEFDRLYQKNYDWEEFCIQNNVNPIEAWYQFTVAKTLPAQRTQVLAFELITDVIRSLLEKDDDGVMPLVDRTGEGLVADRIHQEMIERGYTPTQFSQIVALLGMPLDRYLRDKFFQQLSDHLNLFMYLPKTPFIWHLASGPLHAMELYVSIYKWNRNTLSRVKSVYCANRESGLRDRLATLAQSNDSAAQSETADIRAQLRELSEFVAKLDTLLASEYDPKLDDGVGKNIAPLQKAGILSYAVLKETGGKKSQLNKFLNADW